jgi:hypothetical protein
VGHIYLNEQGTKTTALFDVEDVVVDHAIEDTMGRVTSRHNDIRGLLEPIAVSTMTLSTNRSDPMN